VRSAEPSPTFGKSRLYRGRGASHAEFGVSAGIERPYPQIQRFEFTSSSTNAPPPLVSITDCKPSRIRDARVTTRFVVEAVSQAEFHRSRLELERKPHHRISLENRTKLSGFA